jgi:hypothetical protein
MPFLYIALLVVLTALVAAAGGLWLAITLIDFSRAPADLIGGGIGLGAGLLGVGVGTLCERLNSRPR